MTSLGQIVSPLVDSLSLLVLECVGGSLKDVTTHCVALAQHTQALVDQAQKVAMTTDDTEVVNEIINSINIIADHIGNLVQSFQQLVQDRSNPTTVKAFSVSAQHVADSISNLVDATDETSQKRLIGLVRYVPLLERSNRDFSPTARFRPQFGPLFPACRPASLLSFPHFLPDTSFAHLSLLDSSLSGANQAGNSRPTIMSPSILYLSIRFLYLARSLTPSVFGFFSFFLLLGALAFWNGLFLTSMKTCDPIEQGFGDYLGKEQPR